MALVGVFRLGVAADDARRLLTNRCCGWRRENKRTTKPNHVKLISLARVVSPKPAEAPSWRSSPPRRTATAAALPFAFVIFVSLCFVQVLK